MAWFVAFDLLRLNGDDLRQRSLEKRREALKRLVAKRRNDGVVFSDALEADGALVFAKACEMGLEGIVSKREVSFYRSGRSRNWLKTKNPDFVRT
jgi:ATP-dependent DNA ligase